MHCSRYGLGPGHVLRLCEICRSDNERHSILQLERFEGDRVDVRRVAAMYRRFGDRRLEASVLGMIGRRPEPDAEGDT